MEGKEDRRSCMGINQVKVSVIIPMYNVGKVMTRAIESLYAQTLPGIELIFVNDYSKDDTQNRLEALLVPKEGVEVKIIQHTRNKGVAAARNTGLDHATGEFIYYVDADDYIECNTLEILYNEAKRKGADIVGCEWFLSFKQNERAVKQAQAENGDELFKKFAGGVIRWNLWLFLVKRSLYVDNDIRFIEQMNMGEDMMVMMKLALNANKVSILNVPLYHYIQTNTNSLTKNFLAYKEQVTANANEIALYVEKKSREDLKLDVLQLKLSLKLPLLISNKNSDYEMWMEWFPEANDVVDENKYLPWRTRFIQQCASKKRYWVLKFYHFLFVKLFYGVIYR